MRIVLLVVAVLLALQVQAIDSLQDLLKKGAEAEKKRAKAAQKAPVSAAFSLTSGERIECSWLAKLGDVYRYQRTDGRLVETPAKDVRDVSGEVLSETPAAAVSVHTMYCDGGYCKPSVKVIQVPAWPANH